MSDEVMLCPAESSPVRINPFGGVSKSDVRSSGKLTPARLRRLAGLLAANWSVPYLSADQDIPLEKCEDVVVEDLRILAFAVLSGDFVKLSGLADFGRIDMHGDVLATLQGMHAKFRQLWSQGYVDSQFPFCPVRPESEEFQRGLVSILRRFLESGVLVDDRLLLMKMVSATGHALTTAQKRGRIDQALLISLMLDEAGLAGKDLKEVLRSFKGVDVVRSADVLKQFERIVKALHNARVAAAG
ncbi:MAG: hypothetical protein ABIH41_05615 [Nanoarchaeota archaeon]